MLMHHLSSLFLFTRS